MPDITARLSTALADRYKIESHLGEGGMANVYLAEDLKHERKVAVKVLRKNLGCRKRTQYIAVAQSGYPSCTDCDLNE